MSQRVSASPGALYTSPRRASRRYRCDGHLATERHYVEEGDLIVWCALPPGGEYGYERWQHAKFCVECAPQKVMDRAAVATSSNAQPPEGDN